MASTSRGAGVHVVIPTYEEADNIVEVLTRVRAAVPEATILVVDSGGSDKTAELAQMVGAELGNVEVLVTDHAEGLGGAYRRGFRHAIECGARAIVQMDADLSHEPEVISDLLAALERDRAELVIGSRYIPGGSIPDWSYHRRALSRWGNRYAAFVLCLELTDATSGFRAHRAEMLQRAGIIATTATGYGFQIEVAYRVSRIGGSIVEVPIRFTDRTRGHSKMSPRITFEALGLVTWWSIRDRPWWGRRRRAARRQGTQLPKNASTE